MHVCVVSFRYEEMLRKYPLAKQVCLAYSDFLLQVRNDEELAKVCDHEAMHPGCASWISLARARSTSSVG